MGRKCSVYKCSTNYLSSKENTHEKTIGTIGTILKKKYQKAFVFFSMIMPVSLFIYRFSAYICNSQIDCVPLLLHSERLPPDVIVYVRITQSFNVVAFKYTKYILWVTKAFH